MRDAHSARRVGPGLSSQYQSRYQSKYQSQIQEHGWSQGNGIGSIIGRDSSTVNGFQLIVMILTVILIIGTAIPVGLVLSQSGGENNASGGGGGGNGGGSDGSGSGLAASDVLFIVSFILIIFVLVFVYRKVIYRQFTSVIDKPEVKSETYEVQNVPPKIPKNTDNPQRFAAEETLVSDLFRASTALDEASIGTVVVMRSANTFTSQRRPFVVWSRPVRPRGIENPRVVL